MKNFTELLLSLETELRDPVAQLTKEVNEVLPKLTHLCLRFDNLTMNVQGLVSEVNAMYNTNPNDMAYKFLKALMDKYVADGSAQKTRINAIMDAVDMVENGE